MNNKIFFESTLEDESQTQACAKQFAKDLQVVLEKKLIELPLKIYFSGEIGAAKSCFIRAFLQAIGIKSNIKSPTFSIIESYEVEHKSYVHMDLYRIVDEDELHYLGLDDYFSDATIVLIEWPEKVSLLPKPDFHIYLKNVDFGQKRKISIQSISKVGELVLKQASSNEDV